MYIFPCLVKRYIGSPHGLSKFQLCYLCLQIDNENNRCIYYILTIPIQRESLDNSIRQRDTWFQHSGFQTDDNNRQAIAAQIIILKSLDEIPYYVERDSGEKKCIRIYPTSTYTWRGNYDNDRCADFGSMHRQLFIFVGATPAQRSALIRNSSSWITSPACNKVNLAFHGFVPRDPLLARAHGASQLHIALADNKSDDRWYTKDTAVYMNF